MKRPNNSQVNLTRREKEVLFYISQGLTTKQIGIKLFRSDLTVKSHRKHLLKKLHAGNTAELIYNSLRFGHLKFEEKI